jgi:bZIP Maf transcription factor
VITKEISYEIVIMSALDLRLKISKSDPEISGIFSDMQLTLIGIKELNRKIREKGVPFELAVKIRQRRRMLKNEKLNELK